MKSADGPRAAGACGDWRAPRRFALVLAALVFIAFWNVLLGLDTFVVRDYGIFSYPVAFFQRQCFWKGELPWWNPLNCCGLPFLAQFNTLALYPLSLIYLLLPLTWSLPFFCLLHLFLGGMGMYFLAARWTGSRAGAALAGVVFAFNGLALNFLMWPSHIATFAWMPWVLLLTEAGWKAGGRKLVPAALAAAMQVLAGGPESIFFTWLILLVVGLMECGRGEVAARVLARRFFLMGILAVCLASAQWLPSADFALHCNRNTNYGTLEWSMPAWGWGNFLAPMFQTSKWHGMAVQVTQYWTRVVLRGNRSCVFGGGGFVAAEGVAGLADRRVCGGQPGPGAGRPCARLSLVEAMVPFPGPFSFSNQVCYHHIGAPAVVGGVRRESLRELAARRGALLAGGNVVRRRDRHSGWDDFVVRPALSRGRQFVAGHTGQRGVAPGFFGGVFVGGLFFCHAARRNAVGVFGCCQWSAGLIWSPRCPGRTRRWTLRFTNRALDKCLTNSTRNQTRRNPG